MKTLQEQLAKAIADRRKADADRLKVFAGRRKADADWDKAYADSYADSRKAYAEVDRIQNLIKENT